MEFDYDWKIIREMGSGFKTWHSMTMTFEVRVCRVEHVIQFLYYDRGDTVTAD